MKSIKSLSWIKGLLGIEAVAIPPQVFALDATSVSFGAFARTPVGMELREFHRVALNPETFGEGLVGCDLREERSLREGLDELLSRLEVPVTEAALVLPILLLVTFGAIRYGWFFLKAQQITNAAIYD